MIVPRHDTVRAVLRHTVLLTLAAVTLLPFAWMISTSLKPPSEVFLSEIRWWPERLHAVQNYSAAFAKAPLLLQRDSAPERKREYTVEAPPKSKPPVRAGNPFERELPAATPVSVTRKQRPEPEPRAEAPSAPSPRPPRDKAKSDADMETYRIEVGHAHNVKPANIVGAIANEAGLESQYIGRVDIQDDHSLIDLPAGMPKDIFRQLQKVWVCGQQLRISRIGGDSGPAGKGKFKPRKP